MKPYLIVTFSLSVALVAVRALRFALEGPQVARDPWFVGATAVVILVLPLSGM